MAARVALPRSNSSPELTKKKGLTTNSSNNLLLYHYFQLLLQKLSFLAILVPN